MVLAQINPLPAWKMALRSNFTRLDALANFLELSLDQRSQLLRHPPFSLNVPLRLAKKMKKGTLDDPLLRQFVPLTDELNRHPLFKADPIEDESFRCQKKLLHKYEGRALILCTSACAMHCRYCFRQNFSYEVEQKGFTDEIEAIRLDSSIHEVILSGGDPLSLSDEILDDLLQRLAAIPHVKRVRFHTRFPIGIPERIDQSFLNIIQDYPKQLYFVLHINHPNELDAELFQYLTQLRLAGCVLLNQAVLLKDVNDRVNIQMQLCEELIDQGVIPYYLHQLDRVQGATHFEVSEEEGRALMTELAKRLPGYGVPKYVREVAGEPNKTQL